MNYIKDAAYKLCMHLARSGMVDDETCLNLYADVLLNQDWEGLDFLTGVKVKTYIRPFDGVEVELNSGVPIEDYIQFGRVRDTL